MFDLSNDNFFETRDNFMIQKNVKSNLLFGIRKDSPKASIMIPTYLRNNYLINTIESTLDQDTEMEYEIVIVDNNSDPNDESTLNVVRRYDEKKISYYKNEKNLGMFGNWNRCIELAKSDWLVILHDDDIVEKEYLSFMLNMVSRYSDLGCIGCEHFYIDENSNRFQGKKFLSAKEICKRIVERNSYEITVKDFFYTHPINIMGLFLNKKKAMKVGGFDNKWSPTSDYVFLLNLAEQSRIRCTEKKLLNYRKAVNSSLSIRHLIGMVEVDAYMRKDIDRYLKIMDGEESNRFRSAMILHHEKCLIDNWFMNLNENERVQVIDEYKSFNSRFGVIELTEREMREILRKISNYRRWIKYIRRRPI